MEIKMEPIGFVQTETSCTTQCWKTSDIEGDLVINKKYQKGISDLQKGRYIFVLFHFNSRPPFSERDLKASHPGSRRKYGVFSTLSAVRSKMAIHSIKCESIEVRTESGICPGMAKTQRGEKFTLSGRTPE